MPHEMPLQKVVIIGSGPAGCTAAIYAARAAMQPLVFAGGPSLSDAQRVPGGQLTTTTEVENFPGFPEGVEGPELMQRMHQQAKRLGAQWLLENVQKIDFSKKPFLIEGESTRVLAQTIIIATGACAKWLGAKGEDTYRNKGVSACATCDGFFFKGKEVAVVGGGDTAMEEALFLANLCSRVTVVHRREAFRASQAMQQRVRKNPKIKMALGVVVEEILGNGQEATGLLLKNLETGVQSTLPVQGVFMAIGHSPVTELVEGVLQKQENGYLKLKPGSTHTSLEGVFACGDVADARYRQAITAAATGCMAALDAERYLMELS
ncbi:MAG: thioredoxin-disulfide reductase [Cystobacterineae bacterium]|nr:thioredoxin-disulfide reductase [Cystobacterineae bacterium]